MGLVDVKGYAGLKKDTDNGGVVNTNRTAYKNYKAEKAAALKRHNKQNEVNRSVEHLESEINNIRTEMSEIKDILSRLAEKL